MQAPAAVVETLSMDTSKIPFTAEQLLGISVDNHDHPSHGPAGHFERNAGRINAMSGHDLCDARIDTYLAANVAVGTAERLEPLIDRMRALPEFDVNAAIDLDSLAQTVLHAHTLEQLQLSPPPTIADASKRRSQLLWSLEALVQFEIVSDERVDPLRSVGNSHVALAQSLHGLAQLYREVWPQAAGRTPVTIEMLDHAVELADGVLESVRGGRIECDDLTPGLTPKQVRKRAWTLLVRAYDECRRGVVFLEGEEAADEIAPTLVGAVRRRRSGSEVEDEDQADDDGADEATTTSEGVGAIPSAS